MSIPTYTTEFIVGFGNLLKAPAVTFDQMEQVTQGETLYGVWYDRFYNVVYVDRVVVTHDERVAEAIAKLHGEKCFMWISRLPDMVTGYLLTLPNTEAVRELLFRNMFSDDDISGYTVRGDVIEIALPLWRQVENILKQVEENGYLPATLQPIKFGFKDAGSTE